MVADIRPPIDFSTFPDSDGEPMAENEENGLQMTNLIFTLDHLLAPSGHKVGGNLLMYYNPASGLDHVSPDVYVALDVPIYRRRKWETWIEGKFPEIVFEITSPSTLREDLGKKRSLYARLGVQEYYIYDPAGELSPRFQSFHGDSDRLEPVDLLPSGGIISPRIGYELRPVDEWLCVIDPATDRPFPGPEDERRGRLDAEERAAQAEERAVQAELHVAQAEEQARREEHARLAAEARLAALEALLRGDGGRRHPHDAG
jgi:Uma2 family endonuclease